MKIVVVAGGLSPERNVSLSSGSKIANALIDAGHKVCLADLYMGIESESFDDMFVNSSSGIRYDYTVPSEEPDLVMLKEQSGNGRSLIGKNIIRLCESADIAFLALHGDIGENGRLQAVFDSFGILYTGSGYAGSMLAMDKDLAKRLMLQNNVLTPEWKTYNTQDTGVADNPIGYPCVIKPCGCGSSVGVSIARNAEEYNAALFYAKKYEDTVIVEEMIKGREFSIGILGGEALPIIEIIPGEGFYDYKNKYQPGLTKEICPANLTDEIGSRMQETALRVHGLLRLGSYSRIDFILGEDGNIYFLEANTLPGMTPTSLLPQEAEAAGISYVELCDRIVKMTTHQANQAVR